MRQAAHCRHMPAGLLGGWRRWEGEKCGEITQPFAPLSLGEGAVI